MLVDDVRFAGASEVSVIGVTNSVAAVFGDVVRFAGASEVSVIGLTNSVAAVLGDVVDLQALQEYL